MTARRILRGVIAGARATLEAIGPVGTGDLATALSGARAVLLGLEEVLDADRSVDDLLATLRELRDKGIKPITPAETSAQVEDALK